MTQDIGCSGDSHEGKRPRSTYEDLEVVPIGIAKKPASLRLTHAATRLPHRCASRVALSEPCSDRARPGVELATCWVFNERIHLQINDDARPYPTPRPPP